MLKKIFFIVLLFNIINHCDYKPVYSKQNKTNLKFLISNFTGDKEINNLIVSNLKLNNRNDSKKIINISFDTIYSKNILAKNATGAVTDYPVRAPVSALWLAPTSSPPCACFAAPC